MTLLAEDTQVPFYFCNNGNFISNNQSGKWCIYLHSEDIDRVWKQVKAECNAGNFVAAMGSTKYQRELLRLKTHVICVFNERWDDVIEVNRIRDVLLDLGITQVMKYKRDLNTFRGLEEFEYETVNAITT